MAKVSAVEALDTITKRLGRPSSNSNTSSWLGRLTLWLLAVSTFQLHLSVLLVPGWQTQRRVDSSPRHCWWFHQTIQQAFMQLSIQESIPSFQCDCILAVSHTESLLQAPNKVTDLVSICPCTVLKFLSSHGFALRVQPGT